MHDTKRSHDGAGSTRSLTGRTLKRLLLTGLIGGLVAVSATFASVANADIVGPITFEPSQGYIPGDIGGQQGWMKLNLAYDVKVATVASFPAASRYGFGKQALRVSDFFTTGSFGDQTFSPGLLSPAGELAKRQFVAGFLIGTTQSTLQTGLHMSVSPDNGSGARMSYLRFEDQANGVHVFFDDVKNRGPVGTESTFNEKDIATLSRTRAHLIVFSITFKKGPRNDVVQIYIDLKKKITGTTWEDYYRYDPEAVAHLGQVPETDKLLFRESGAATPLNSGNGFLVDDVTLASLGH
jgi:hypothetical protein